MIKNKSRQERNQIFSLLMLSPALLFLVLLIGYPLIKVIYNSFNYTHLINESLSGFSGLENFRKVLSDPHIGQATKNTFIWTIGSVLGEYILGLGSALLLNKKVKGQGIFRALTFIPWLVPIIVAGMTWNWMLNPDFGIVNYLLTKIGIIDSSINFLGNQNTAMGTVIFVNIWRSFPYYTISFLAALQSIPEELYEAASIDGANNFGKFKNVTLPQLKSVSLVILFIHTIWTAVNFDFIWVLTEGGPNYATETLPIMIYRYSMQKFDVGVASALSTMMLGGMSLLFVVYYRQRSKLSEELLG